MIYYVKRHYAPPEVEVTESKMMTDRDTGEQREVDIVMEGTIGDEPVVISIEVSTGTRPKGSPWVESMLSKHDRMPTNRLVLVSQIVNRVMNQEVVGRELLDQAYASENREALTHFSHEMADLDDRGLYAHDGNADRFRLISGWRIVGPVTLRQQPVEFTIMRLGDTVFAMTELQMGGRDAVWVLTPNNDGTDTATVSWRLV